MRISAGFDGLDAALRDASASVFSVVDAEVEDASEGLKTELRDQTDVMLGPRVARTWRNRFYSNNGDSKGPAGFVWSRAPRILSFFTAERVVTPVGHFFAIPVAGVVGRRGRKATIAEVEARFGRLKFIPFKNGNAGLFAKPLGKRGRGKRQQLTLMFVLFKGPLNGQKLIDLDAIAQRWGAKVAANIDRKLGA